MKHITKCLMCGWKSEPGGVVIRCCGCGYFADGRAGALVSFPVETETVECPACDWRGPSSAAYQTKAGPVCPNCIDEGGHSKLVPAATHPPLSAKPPLGPTPDYIWRETRLEELTQACSRYLRAGMLPDPEWMSETAEHTEWFMATGREVPKWRAES